MYVQHLLSVTRFFAASTSMAVRPALRFEKLPKDSQERALAAARTFDWVELCGLYEDIHAVENPVKFLPVCYAALAGDTIATLAAQLQSDLDEDESMHSAIQYVMFCLTGINSCGAALPISASAELWPVVWPAIQFLDSYRDVLFGTAATSQLSDLYALFLALICKLRRHGPTETSINTTRGFRVLLFRILDVFLTALEIGDDPDKFAAFCYYIVSGPEVTEPWHFMEAVEGGGGTKGALAALLVRHAERVRAVACHTGDAVISPALLSLGHPSTISYIHDSVFHDNVIDEFRTALWASGIVAPFIEITLRLTKPPYSTEDKARGMSVNSLARIWAPVVMDGKGGYNGAEQLIRGGVLQLLVGFAELPKTAPVLADVNHPITKDIIDILEDIICLLQNSLVCFSLLSLVEGKLDGITEALFDGSPLSDGWKRFWSVLEQRREIVKKCFVAAEPPKSACDNVVCGVIRLQSEFKRCSGCLTLNYCSTECQRFDWREGGHRESCKSLLKLRQDDVSRLDSKDRAFLRAILDHDYQRFKQEVLTKQIDFLRSRPDVETPELLTMFGYVANCREPDPLRIFVVLKPKNLWEDYYSRAMRSKGKMHIHAMNILNCSQLFPLRCATGTVVMEMERIARMAGDSTNAEADRVAIARLVEQNVEEIYLAPRN
ncbi:hypothetical protein C8R46DRAFT_1350867 [Mycena filopes]|nr:hypothetical protein C8R46DRAFT_1350867 [Mycena filopes]